MWIVYCLHYEQPQPRLEIFCYSNDFTSAIDALDDYAITKYRLSYPDYPKDRNPLEVGKDQLPGGVDRYLELDKSSINPLGDAERILLIDNKSGHTVAHYEVAAVGKYVDDYNRERTQAVAQLERDAAINFDQEILEEVDTSSSSSDDDDD